MKEISEKMLLFKEINCLLSELRFMDEDDLAMEMRKDLYIAMEREEENLKKEDKTCQQ